MFGVIFLCCFGIIAQFELCFVLGYAHFVTLFDVRAKALVCSATDVTDYISSVVIGNLAKRWDGIVNPTSVVISVTTLASAFWINPIRYRFTTLFASHCISSFPT